MQSNSDKRWLFPVIIITVATIAVYTTFLISDFQNSKRTDTYQVTVEQTIPDAPSPAPTTKEPTEEKTEPPQTEEAPTATPGNNIMHATDVPEGSYIGNKNSEKYHRFDCEYGAKVQDNNLIVFDTLEDAVNSGYMPCGACHPDE